MVPTVTPGELKIIEANVRGLGSKEKYIKQFLSRKRKKADIFCIVEHKTTDNKRLLEQFSTGAYRVGASYCRATQGGGVALLVHGSLMNVQDVQDKFNREFDTASRKGVEIAGIELNLKAKDCLNNLFVFGVYRRSSSSNTAEFCNIICELLQKVRNNFQSSAVFTGDFNLNNSRDAQTIRDNKTQEVILKFKNVGYKMTHKKPSHTLGSCLNNFLVPLQMKYYQKTITEGFKIPKETRRNSPREPDHMPIQVVITLENTGIQQVQQITGSYAAQTSVNKQIYAPSTSGTGLANSVGHVNKVILNTEIEIIIISSDEESSSPLPPNTSHGGRKRPHTSSRQYKKSQTNQSINFFQASNDVTLTKIKIEREQDRRISQGNPPPLQRALEENSAVNSVVPSAINPSAMHTNTNDTPPDQRPHTYNRPSVAVNSAVPIAIDPSAMHTNTNESPLDQRSQTYNHPSVAGHHSVVTNAIDRSEMHTIANETNLVQRPHTYNRPSVAVNSAVPIAINPSAMHTNANDTPPNQRSQTYNHPSVAGHHSGVTNSIDPSAMHTNANETTPVQRPQLSNHSGNMSAIPNQSQSFVPSPPTLATTSNSSFHSIGQSQSPSTSNHYTLDMSTIAVLNSLASSTLGSSLGTSVLATQERTHSLTRPVPAAASETLTVNSRTFHETVTSRSYQEHNVQTTAPLPNRENQISAEERAALLEQRDELKRKERLLKIFAELELNIQKQGEINARLNDMS